MSPAGTGDRPADGQQRPQAICSCGRTPDPGVCPGTCAPGLPADGHCRCACDGTPFPLATPLGSSPAGSNETGPAVATPATPVDLRQAIKTALETADDHWCNLNQGTDYGALADTVLAVLAERGIS